MKKRIDADYTALAEKIETNSKSAEFKVDDKVRITKYQTFSALELIYYDKKIQKFLNKLLSQDNYGKMMVHQCFHH